MKECCPITAMLLGDGISEETKETVRGALGLCGLVASVKGTPEEVKAVVESLKTVQPDVICMVALYVADVILREKIAELPRGKEALEELSEIYSLLCEEDSNA